jgi:hypothetical protein
MFLILPYSFKKLIILIDFIYSFNYYNTAKEEKQAKKRHFKDILQSNLSNHTAN